MSVRPVRRGFSPLDEALGLSANSPYGPHVLGWLAHLGALLPFAQAAALLAELTGLSVSASTLRRHTEALGATAVAQEEAAVARVQRELPEPVTHPERLVLGADGAMVPLVQGEWAEVKLLSVGAPDAQRAGERLLVRTADPVYFARLADAETFAIQALAELHRQGVDGAQAVAAVQDGALWLQGFVEYHRPDAVRILDWAHAAEHLSGVAEQVFGQGTVRAQRAADRLRGWLWQEGPERRVLRVLAAWARACPDRPALERAVAYFQERRAQVDYPTFRAAGWPVGSGATESGHKQVMQARMKQAGMRWQRSHVNPLLALSLLEHNDRWTSEGSALLAHHRSSCLAQRRARRQAHHRDRLVQRPAAQLAACPASPPASQVALESPAPAAPLPSSPRDHPWRRYGTWLSTKI